MLVPGLLCFGFFAWGSNRSGIARGKSDQRIEPLRLAGLPFDYASLRGYYESLTENRNAATWLSFMETLSSETIREQTKDFPFMGIGPDIPPFNQHWNERQRVSAFLDRVQPTIEQLHEVAARNHGVCFPGKFESWDTLSSNVQEMRQLSRILSLEHAVAIRNGDAEREFNAINSGLGISIALRSDPHLVSQLVSVALHGMAAGNLQNSIRHGNLAPDHLHQLRQRLQHFEDYKLQFDQAINGERVIGMELFRNPDMFGFNDQSHAFMRIFAFRHVDRLHYLTMLDQAQQFRNDSLEAFIADAQQWNEAVEDKLKGPFFEVLNEYQFTGMILPPLHGAATALARQVMRNRLAITAVAIRQYERQTGQLPPDLTALVEVGLQLDQVQPIQGDHFGYRIEDNHAIIWGYNPLSGSHQAAAGVPDEPPPTDNDGTVDEIQLEQNREWVWLIEPLR